MRPTHSLSVRPRRPLSPTFGALVALAILVACDSGTPAKDAAPTKAAPAAKAEPGKSEPAKVEPTKVVEPAARVTPQPTPTPTPTPVPEPAPDPILDAPDPAADPVEPPTEPTDVADTPDTPEPAVTGSGSTPIALGPEAELLQLVLAHDVANRQPVDPATRFPAGQKVNLFIEARNEGEEEQSIRITWETVSSGRRTPPVGVAIPTRKLHRTRAYRTMKKAGEYRCIVLGDDDRELAVLPFTIE